MENEALHTHSFKKTIVPPTCKDSGYTLYACECGYEYKTDFQPMGPHNFEIVESTPATCVEPGRGKLVCATCGATQEQTFAPIGHTYGEWTVQAYPTCTEMGRSVRKCERCGATQEENTPAIGHKCVPGTERRVQGRVVDYFCSNCGQTIAGAPPSVELETQNSGSGVALTRVMLILATVAALLNMFLMPILRGVGYLHFSNVIVAFSYPVMAIVANVILTINAGKMKRNTHYTRGMGVVMLLCAIPWLTTLVDNLVLYIGYNAMMSWSTVVDVLANSLPIVAYLFLAIVFFCGTKKRRWVQIVAAVCLALCVAYCAINEINFIFLTGMRSIWWLLVKVKFLAADLMTILSWLGLCLLIAPAKKRKLQ